MRTIYKYPINLEDRVRIEMPVGAKVLDVQYQRTTKDVCIWALVDTDKPMEGRIFSIDGTGNKLHSDCSAENYVGTFQLRDGEFVFHLFDLS